MKRESPIQPASTDIERILHRKPGYMIRRLQQMAVSIFFDETAQFEITPIQYATLAVVSVYPGIDQLRVANATGIDRATISGVIDRLEAKGLIVRRVSDKDRRANGLFPTANAAGVLAEMEEATERVEKRILAPLSSAERAKFLSSLDRLVVSHNHASRVPVDNTLIPAQSRRQKIAGT